MSGHADHHSDDKYEKGRKRDISPSASQSSGLEWDSSADVLTFARHVGVGPASGLDTGVQTTDLAHEVDPNLAGPSTGPRRIVRSRSYEYPTETRHDEHLSQQHKLSLGELAQRPLALVHNWVRNRYLDPDSSDANLLETMVSGFTSRRQFIEAVQPERPVSTTSTIVSTIIPPPNSRPDSQKSSSGHSSLPNDLKRLDAEIGISSEEHVNRTHSNEAVGTKSREVIPPRSQSMSKLELGLYDSTTAPTVSSRGSGLSRYTLSDFSTEMDRIRQSQKDSSGMGMKGSGISDWLEVGMTKSEKEFKKKKGDDRSSSMIFVEVKHDFDTKNKSGRYEDLSVRNIGVQTSTIGKDSSDEIRGSTLSGCSSIYHSTPAGYRQANFAKNSKDEKVDKKQKSSGLRSQPVVPFAAASRKSSHKHHHAHHSRNHDTEISSLIESRHEDVQKTGTSSSDLSPPCFLLDKLVKTQTSQLKKKDVADAIEIHRDYHVKKVRHELRQLEKLNQLLGRYFSERQRQKKKQRYSSSETEAQTTPYEDTPHSSLGKSRGSPRKNVRVDSDKQKSSSRSSPKNPMSEPSLTGISDLLKDIKQSSSQGRRDSVEKKLDELMDAFSFIAGMLIEKDDKKNVSTKEGKKETKKPCTQTKPKENKQPPCEPPKPPVAYFIPFTNCQGQYVFRKEDIDFTGGGGRKPEKPVVNTESRTVSRQQRPQRDTAAGGSRDEEEEENGSGSWEDANEDIENRDPADAEIPYVNQRPAAKPTFTLQDAFERRCPNFLSRLREREAVLARIKSERELRAEKKREWIRLYGKTNRDLEDLDSMLPPKGPRLMTTKEMREITKRHYKNLPEVQDKVIQKRALEEKKTNRIMSQVFAQVAYCFV
ncbi:Alstrom syndrome protein 1 [Folsomia candida]|uniref:Alstrom syndrome protein 1 n=1 Tax=Folsomia candida TaxID=158441 RepID=A0A226E6B0_FOLCA|nr:Alstrom syndrome protein 1 [Folsomia candida]